MLIDLIALSMGYVLLLARWRKKDIYFHTLIYIYLVAVFLLTLSPCISSITSIFSHPYKPMMMEPFRDMLAGYENADWQVVLNVLLFIPLGFLLPKIRKVNLKHVLLISFIISLSIELIQPLLNTARCSDITDIICNTFGGVLGYILYKQIKK